MDRLRGKGADAAPHRAPAGEGEANLGIGGAGDRTEQVGRDDADFMPRAAQLADRRLQCADDAVDLRLPRVGDDQYPHSAAGSASLVVALRAAPSTAQGRTFDQESGGEGKGGAGR